MQANSPGVERERERKFCRRLFTSSLKRFASQLCSNGDGEEIQYTKSALHVQGCCFGYETYRFSDAVVAVALRRILVPMTRFGRTGQNSSQMANCCCYYCCISDTGGNLVKLKHLRCFETVFQRPYRRFSIALKEVFALSDRYKFSIAVIDYLINTS